MIFTHIFDDKKAIEKIKFKFDLEKNVSNICITLIDGSFEHAPIVIKDPTGEIRGLMSLKTRKKTRFIGKTDAETSNGMIAGKLPIGEWTVEIIKPSTRVTKKMQIEISDNEKYSTSKKRTSLLNQDWNCVYSDESRWYTVELHCHNYFSDGRVTMEDVQQLFEQSDLDAIALMDHSVINTLHSFNSSLVIPGTELTIDDEVHYNIFGVKDLIDYDAYFSEDCSKNEALNKMFTDLSNKKSLLSMNHLFDDGMTLQHDFDVSNFSFVEIINAPYVENNKIANAKAIRFYDFLRNKGFQLFGIGGSDAHRKNYNEAYPLGIPTNHIKAPKLTLNNVISAMKKGRVFVTDRIKCDVKYSNADNDLEVLPGDEFSGTLRIVANSNDKVNWKLIDNGLVLEEQVGKSCHFQINVNVGHYVRLEAWKNETPVVFVNPVTNNCSKKISTSNFRTLLDEFEEVEKRG